MSRYDASLTLISVLDQLRDAYDVAKEAGHTDLQDRLMSARRQLMDAVHQSLNLHSELAEAQEQLAEIRGNGDQQASTARILRALPDPLPRRAS